MASQVYLQDSQGTIWAVTVNHDGSLTTTPTSLTGPNNVSSSCTASIQSTINWAQTFSKLVPLLGVGSIANEPGLTIANNTMQRIFSRPFAWKWNTNPMTPIFTRVNIRDYIYSGAVAFVLQSNANGLSATNQGGVAIDLATNNAITEVGNLVTVNTLEQHPFQVGQNVAMLGNTVSAYNSVETIIPIGNNSGKPSVQYSTWTITAVPSTTSFQFTHLQSGLAVSGAPGVYNFGWLEYASLIDPNAQSFPLPETPIYAVQKILPNSDIGDPEKVSMQFDNGNGTLQMRIWPAPGTYMLQINPVYQAKAPILTSVLQLWCPIPDDHAYVYKQGFLSEAWKFIEDARADKEEAKFLMKIQEALGKADTEQADMNLTPFRGLFVG